MNNRLITPVQFIDLRLSISAHVTKLSFKVLKCHTTSRIYFCFGTDDVESTSTIKLSKALETPRTAEKTHTMATHYTSPEYFDIILLIRRFNMNYVSGDNQRLNYQIPDSLRESCRKMEAGAYSTMQQDIDYLVKSLLFIRRASSVEDHAWLDTNYEKLSWTFIRVVKGGGKRAADSGFAKLKELFSTPEKPLVPDKNSPKPKPPQPANLRRSSSSQQCPSLISQLSINQMRPLSSRLRTRS